MATVRREKTTMERTFARTCGLLLSLLVIVSNSQQFNLPSPSPRSPGLQVDGDGKIYSSAGNQLYRLNSSLGLEESWGLRTDAVNISLSSDGMWLVVCLNDLSCEVYSANNFSAGQVFRRENTIISTGNIALFAAEDSFYVGGITVSGIRQTGIVLGQYGFGGGQGSSASRSYAITANGFIRNFYGSGFIRGNNTYYFAVDNDPSSLRSLKVMRVCHNSDFGALYELALTCGTRRPGSSTRISGVSVVDSFAGMSGPTIVLSINRPLPSSSNLVCLYSLEAIDGRMQDKLNSCAVATNMIEQIELSWRIEEPLCSTDFSLTDRCHFGNLPPALDDMDNSTFPLGGDVRVDLSQPSANFITVSAAAIVESFLLVFVGYSDGNGVAYISGFAIKNTTTSALTEDQGFDKRTIPGGPVSQIQIQSELGMVYAVTDVSVIQFPIADCASHLDCTSCLGNGNPLCGWCVLENKCSRMSECLNSEDSARWIQAARTNTDQCPTITVSPEQYVMDNPQTITLTVSQSLPMLQENETYSCHFAGNEATFTVPAVGSGATYICNITGSIPEEYGGLATVLNVSFISSLQGVPFSTNVGGLTIYMCSATSNCSQCLQTNNACGWCVYNKVCSGTADPCLSVNGTDTYLQPDLDMGQTFRDVCPLLDQPSPGMNYQQPVLINQDVELVTRNLPPEIASFSYMCRVGSEDLQATYNNETSLTCSVDMNTFTLPDRVGQRSVDVTIRWIGPNNIDHPIDAVTPVSVILYSCAELADSCSSCLSSEFECSWCGTPNQPTGSCAYSGLGGVCDAVSITVGSDCAGPRITDFNPKSGPPEGGTTITITGTDLGISFNDFTAPGSSIQVGGVTCTPTNPDSYIPGRRINCTTTSSGGSTGLKLINITLPNGAGRSNVQFNIVSPQITRVFPSRGPQAGGTQLTVYGTDLNIGNIEDTRITLVGGTECTTNQAGIQATNITCTTTEFTASAPPMSGTVVVMIDSATVNNTDVQYMYTPNPVFYNVIPPMTILGGGIELIFNGTNLDVVQRPMLVVNDTEYVNVTSSTLCEIINSTAIRCITPPLNRMQPGDNDGITYTIRVDNAPGPDPLANASLQIIVLPNPRNFQLVDTEYNTGSTTLIRIMGENFNSVTMDNFNITVGGQLCDKLSVVSDTQINCVPPPQPPDGNTQATVVVSVGQYISETTSTKLRYIDAVAPSEIPLVIIIPVIAGGLLIVVIFSMLIICCVVCYHRSKSKKTEQRWTNLLSQMELMELEMADECKRAFTELQTDLADLVQISDANLPYRDFRSFAMRFLFPQAGSDHPVLLPLQLPEKTEQDKVVESLKSFQSLIMDKKFLLVFIHTLEGQGGRFTLQDKCSVASLLMVAFQNDLDYATDVLQTLLSELMRKSLNNKSHPKLLLRRTESVAEKMLANWLAFLLFPYLLDHVGQPLFTLYRAIKSQLEKGPVDIITGEARHSLSEEKLLRQHIEVKSVEGVVEPESGDDINIKMLDCDSITQAKEKVLDALYKNCPASKRPQLTEVDLILQCGTASLTLRDQDHTNKREGDWIKINTLGSYNVDEMSQKHQNNSKLPIPRFKLEKRPERPVSGASFDTLGTIIANIGAESRGNMMTSGELSHVFHLVKTEADEGDDVEKRGGKIMSEVFLTRLLSTKRILQPYVDAVFDSIFTVPQGRPLPKAVKCLFDFLDLQASDLGIQDPEILHTWKTNSVPLRFWVNVIKNPDFVFDIHKSATVDSCLTVIAQAYIDACSTAELKYSKDTPSARLLYVNEVKKYKHDVQQYYNSVQSQPKLSQYEMGEYLRETAQVCANSVEQVEPDIASNDLGPASMTRQLYFVQESALHELFKFAAQYSEEIIDGLNEEGLSIMATNFQQLKSSIPV